jgi:hypothetical protein
MEISMKINMEKLEIYTNKLYKAKLSRYKDKKKIDSIYSYNTFLIDERRIKKVKPKIQQEKKVRDIYSDKCVVCNRIWDANDFKLHHVNGDRSQTITHNLVPMCNRCQRRVRRESNAMLKTISILINHRHQVLDSILKLLNHQILNIRII